ncbi:hypothetical protein O181_004249 [Austropuccinia psidii MF-1]|uniref:Uncharacterized protein n=1 Tax=Austropuccinia psidii MF-1 TaxID=1389203 RepID=A0A9Q3BFI1_9BASI|nr:hypothetical protein [Austropuccinia psidii MF-1]
MSRISDWGERAYIHVQRRSFESILFYQLSYHPGNVDGIQELRDMTLELDTRYHEKQKEKGSHQEKKPQVTSPNSFRPLQASSFTKPHQKKNKGKYFHVALLNEDNTLIHSKQNRMIKEGS